MLCTPRPTLADHGSVPADLRLAGSKETPQLEGGRLLFDQKATPPFVHSVHDPAGLFMLLFPCWVIFLDSWNAL